MLLAADECRLDQDRCCKPDAELLEVQHNHHTDCGMLVVKDDDFCRQIQAGTGIKPEGAAKAFDDLEQDVRQSVARIKASPLIPTRNQIRGFVYDVESGRLTEVS
jgi:carbonic anhydrase